MAGAAGKGWWVVVKSQVVWKLVEVVSFSMLRVGFLLVVL